MVEGLKFDVPGAELRDLIQAEIDRRMGRAKTYEEMAERLGAEDLSPGESHSHGRDAKERAQKHRQECDRLSFMRDHVRVTESYLLNEHELRTIGVIRGY